MTNMTERSYESMSDAEVNKAVAEALGMELSNYFGDDFGYYICKESSPMGMLVRVSEYCSEWNMIMPIAEEHKISVDWVEDMKKWSALSPAGSQFNCINYQHENPRRALAICFLKMNE